MDLRLMAAVTGPLTGVNVSALCRQHGISRKTFYKWRVRYRAEGLAGLEPRSRRPHRSPRRVSVEVEEAVVALRKELADAGLDAGAATIRWHLGKRRIVRPLPSEATIWRVLVRRGFVIPQPRKRPKSSLRRFEAEFPNQMWQIDFIEWALVDLTTVAIFNIVDDHARLLAESKAVVHATSDAAWEAFSTACHRYGVPWRCLSDNGLCFSGKLKGFEVFFEAQLRAIGVKPLTSRPYHPQTCGKVERFQQTLKKRLRAQGPFETIEELQRALDRFRNYYNHQRPHRSIGRLTPYQRWSATPRLANPSVPLPSPRRQTHVVLNQRGMAHGSRYTIPVGKAYANRPAEIHSEAGYINVFIDGRLVRHLQLDPTRRYQALRAPRRHHT